MATEQELEKLVVRLMGDGSSYMKMMDEAEKSANKLSDGLESKRLRMRAFSDGLKGYAGQIAGMITGAVGGFGLLNTVSSGVRLAADAERSESSFKVMLHSAEKASKLMGDLQKFAAETPLEMTDLTQFSQMLLQAKVPAKDLVDTLRMIGDVAMGDKQKMHGLAYAFSQVKTFTHLMGGELMQMRNAGFDPLAEMAKTSGKNVDQLRGEMEKGLITFDMVAAAFKSASSEGGDFFNGMKEASTTLSGLWSTLLDDFAGFQRAIGKEIVTVLHLKDAAAAASSVFQYLTDTFKALPTWVRQGIIVIGGLLAVMGILGIVGPAVAAAWTMAWGGITAGLAAVAGVGVAPLALLVAIGGAIVALVQRAGGIQAVWDGLVSGAQQFWEYIKPIRQAVQSLFDTIVGVGQQAWQGFVYWVNWGYDQTVALLTQLGQWITANTGMTWDGLRDGVRDAFLMAEFTITHFQQVWETVWSGIKYFAVAALNLILNNIFAIIAGPALLPAFMVLGDNWKETLTGMAVSAATAFQEMLRTVVQFAAQMAIALAGGNVDVNQFASNMAIRLANAFKGTSLNFKGIKVDALDQLEAQLKQEFEANKGKLNESWEEFKKRKLDEFAKENPQASPEEKGEEDAKKYASGLTKGIKGSEAVLFNSAEAMSRRLEYIERLREGRQANTAPGQPGGSVQGATANGLRLQEQQRDLLKDIAGNTKAAAGKDVVPVQPANL